LPALDRSQGRSAITTGTFVSFLTGLAPAALPALWAAHQGKLRWIKVKNKTFVPAWQKNAQFSSGGLFSALQW
jgi:hypothetical protein